MARGVVVDDNGFWNMGSMGLFAMLAQLSPIAGDSLLREILPSERGERKAGLLEKSKKSVSVGGKTWARRKYPAWGSIALRDLSERTDAGPCTALWWPRGESRCRYAMDGAVGNFEFGALLREGRRGVAWVADGIGRIGR